jgi:hypothetical protein
MIEHVDLVLQRNPWRFEAGYPCDVVARSHITRRIVIEADDQYIGVCSARRLDHFVQVQEIIMISRHQLARRILCYARGKNGVGPEVSLTVSKGGVSCWHNWGTAADGRLACRRHTLGPHSWTNAFPEARPLDERGEASQSRQDVYSNPTLISSRPGVFCPLTRTG